MQHQENLISQVLDLKGLLTVQEGAVVSRALVDKPQGTVTLFAFDEGEGLSQHTAPFDAMIQILSGEAEVTISDKPYELSAGQMIVMPANEPHALRAITPFKMLLVMIRGDE